MGRVSQNSWLVYFLFSGLGDETPRPHKPKGWYHSYENDISTGKATSFRHASRVFDNEIANSAAGCTFDAILEVEVWVDQGPWQPSISGKRSPRQSRIREKVRADIGDGIGIRRAEGLRDGGCQFLPSIRSFSLHLWCKSPQHWVWDTNASRVVKMLTGSTTPKWSFHERWVEDAGWEAMVKSEGRRVLGGKEKHSVRKNSRYARGKHSNLVRNFRQRISTRKHRAAMFVGSARLVILLLIIISVCLLDVEGNLKDSPRNQVHSEVKLQPIVNMQNLIGFTALSGELRMSEVWSGAFTPEFVSLLSPYFRVEILSNEQFGWEVLDWLFKP